ncbi:acyltransferase family protein [Flavobacterium pectinovorum]|uniref:acyltransferase family protein n=1 Tax=Flavobacterium pectinovorum TaxID=29533 RepID=UPI001FAC483D|nr:acyltransferase [Flavobacterium pectinovorum]MCI9845389.1 acyltransferase [Flavobacterium pectinovorum]
MVELLKNGTSSMNNLNPLFAVIIFLIAYCTAYVINLKYKVNNLSTRYESVDGLRGFLAISVFISHASLWYQYIQKEQWASKSYFYTQLGSTSVAFFFMISSFLFISKLLNTGKKEFNWKAFFISRLFRLVPMYYFSVAIIVFLVIIISDWSLKVGVFEFLHEMFLWGTFAVIRDTSINGFGLTYLINAGVVWSLPFEWLFYFSLPVISILILKRKPSAFYLFISLVFIGGYFYVNSVHVQHLLSFVGGILAAVVVKYKPFQNKDNKLFSILILVCLALIIQFEKSTNMPCKILITIIFILISSGNTLFGILKSSTLKFMREISYSIYLIHGIILFVVFYFGFGLEEAKTLSASEFCVVVFLVTPVVVILSFVCYRFIEKPFMEISKKC